MFRKVLNIGRLLSRVIGSILSFSIWKNFQREKYAEEIDHVHIKL